VTSHQLNKLIDLNYISKILKRLSKYFSVSLATCKGLVVSGKKYNITFNTTPYALLVYYNVGSYGILMPSEFIDIFGNTPNTFKVKLRGSVIYLKPNQTLYPKIKNIKIHHNTFNTLLLDGCIELNGDLYIGPTKELNRHPFV